VDNGQDCGPRQDCKGSSIRVICFHVSLEYRGSAITDTEMGRFGKSANCSGQGGPMISLTVT
jgi:hypothetical protein